MNTEKSKMYYSQDGGGPIIPGFEDARYPTHDGSFSKTVFAILAGFLVSCIGAAFNFSFLYISHSIQSPLLIIFMSTIVRYIFATMVQQSAGYHPWLISCVAILFSMSVLLSTILCFEMDNMDITDFYTYFYCYIEQLHGLLLAPIEGILNMLRNQFMYFFVNTCVIFYFGYLAVGGQELKQFKLL